MNKQKKTVKQTSKNKTKKLQYYYAVGRRKEASAQIRIYPVTTGKVKVGDLTLKRGDIVVNDRPIEKYFPGEVYQKFYLEPFRTTNTIGQYAVSAKIVGGGLSGQLGAFIHGVSRCLEKINKDKFRPILKKKGFLTRDARVKERRKAGYAQKARAKKQSPKR